jgi:hypothetical protein
VQRSSAAALYDRTARAFQTQIHQDMLGFRQANVRTASLLLCPRASLCATALTDAPASAQPTATLQDWARGTSWSGPPDGPVDSQGVPRIPQQGVFVELWRSVGSVREQPRHSCLRWDCLTLGRRVRV